MTSKILPFYGPTMVEIPVSTVCESAKDCDDVLIIGYVDDRLYIGSSRSDIAEALLKLEQARDFLMAQLN